ncbi:MAG: hypothetical protein H6821_14790 [Planctomycetaceae bacterium]|nr:hypothetical protein [Planctomycetales bacterium]MCB9875437.1 hypothetical protein [Planctomycetaceae bacterium]MCB9938503.1 hypothetical protein [Planctomycetaceae bacterium]
MDAQEVGPLNRTLLITIRLVIVLAFLLGMPLIAVPQISEQLRGMWRGEPRGPIERGQEFEEQIAASDELDPPELDTAVTMLASDRSPSATAEPNPASLTTTIEALKAQFVEAGVTYMVLEQIGTDATKYRFQFDVPVAAGSAYKKRFQVIDDAPDEAMRLALTELHQWRVAAREPAHLERPTVILR